MQRPTCDDIWGHQRSNEWKRARNRDLQALLQEVPIRANHDVQVPRRSHRHYSLAVGTPVGLKTAKVEKHGFLGPLTLEMKTPSP